MRAKYFRVSNTFGEEYIEGILKNRHMIPDLPGNANLLFIHDLFEYDYHAWVIESDNFPCITLQEEIPQLEVTIKEKVPYRRPPYTAPKERHKMGFSVPYCKMMQFMKYSDNPDFHIATDLPLDWHLERIVPDNLRRQFYLCLSSEKFPPHDDTGVFESQPNPFTLVRTNQYQ